MEKHHTLLLSIWREVSKHLRIEESVDRIAPLIARRSPAEYVLIRRIDAARSAVETLAWGRCRRGTEELKARVAAKSQQSRAETDSLLAWSDSRTIYRGSTRKAYATLPGLLPPGIEGHVVAGPLLTEEGRAGILMLLASPPREFEVEHESLAEALLEPFAAALENDRRLRELTSLREAVEAENRTLLSKLGRYDISESVIGADTGLKSVMEQIELVARSDAPVLVQGETGAGKEVVAREIHIRSRRASGPFLRVNCGAIPPELVDSELFGHERGSFTGAVGERKGWFERADGGSLFLDECGELPLAAQVRLLRVLQDGSLERVGGERQLHVDVRVIAATHRDLRAMVADGRFREDLWYRIAVFPIRLPALRDRPEDVPSLASHFALRSAKRLGIPPVLPTAEDIRLLREYAWPGNVRELAAVIERAAILGAGARLEIARALGGGAMPPAAAASSPADRPIRIPDDPPREVVQPPLALDQAMSAHIAAALEKTAGRIEGPHGAAALLAVNPHTLRSRMRKLGIDWRGFRRR